jgi:hypothetical protein
VQSKVSDVVLGKEKPVEESNPEYEKLKHYIFELENRLAEAQKHAYRLVKRHRGNSGLCYCYMLTHDTSLSCFTSFRHIMMHHFL